MEKDIDYEWKKETEANHEIKEHCSPRCPRCQGNLQTMEIHGHEQCVLCHSIIEDCCQGAPQK